MEEPDDELIEVSDRLVTAAEMAEIMDVAEADVVGWIADGRLPSESAEDGSRRVRVSESPHQDTGPFRDWIMFFRTNGGPEFDEEIDRRRRAHQRSHGDPGHVDVEALTDALAARLRSVAPREALVTIVDTGFIRVGSAPGLGAGIGLMPADAGDRTDAERVFGVVQQAIATAQDEFAELSTDPWPVRGSGSLPDPHAEFTADGGTIRLWYGDSADPVLELEPLRLADVLRG